MHVTCPKCRARIRVPDATDAERGRCPSCREVIHLRSESTPNGSTHRLVFCESCGRRLEPNAQFCAACGAGLGKDLSRREVAIPAPPPQPVQPTTYEPEPQLAPLDAPEPVAQSAPPAATAPAEPFETVAPAQSSEPTPSVTPTPPIEPPAPASGPPTAPEAPAPVCEEAEVAPPREAATPTPAPPPLPWRQLPSEAPSSAPVPAQTYAAPEPSKPVASVAAALAGAAARRPQQAPTAPSPVSDIARTPHTPPATGPAVATPTSADAPMDLGAPSIASHKDTEPSDLGKSALGAAIGAVIGAFVWAMVTFLTGWELGMLAMLVGILSGLGAVSLNGGKRSIEVGAIAALIGLVGVGIGSYVGYRLWLHKNLAEIRAESIDEDPFVVQEFREASWLDDINGVSVVFGAIGLSWGFKVGAGLRLRRLTAAAGAPPPNR